MWQNSENSEIIFSMFNVIEGKWCINIHHRCSFNTWDCKSSSSDILFVLGHPAPQLVWYKEDVQLDRYCGLPKYEIAHSGHHHSLHIYKYVCLEA